MPCYEPAVLAPASSALAQPEVVRDEDFKWLTPPTIGDPLRH
jgi:hypothetical protein